MALLRAEKVVATLPENLEANTIYFVRVASWFDIYVTNDTWTIVAYPLNQTWGSWVQNLFIQSDTPTPAVKSLWIDTSWAIAKLKILTP